MRFSSRKRLNEGGRVSPLGPTADGCHCGLFIQLVNVSMQPGNRREGDVSFALPHPPSLLTCISISLENRLISGEPARSRTGLHGFFLFLWESSPRFFNLCQFEFVRVNYLAKIITRRRCHSLIYFSRNVRGEIDLEKVRRRDMILCQLCDDTFTIRTQIVAYLLEIISTMSKKCNVR